MTDKISFQVLAEGPHVVLNALTGKKTIVGLKKDHKIGEKIYYVDGALSKVDKSIGVCTRKRTIKTVDVLVEAGSSLMDLFEFFPGVLSKKWLSQSQISKIYKHFRNHLASDDLPNLFLAKKSESAEIDEDNPWKNLQIIEVIIDHDDDANFRSTSSDLIFSKSLRASKFRVFIPVRCGQK